MELAIAKDKQDLERLEGVIKRNIQSFYEVGRALMEIRDRELYLLKNGGAYQTFEAYCKGAWDFKRTYAFYLMESAKVIDNVHNCEQVPTTESQARPLSRLEPDQQREAWQKAVETAPEGKVTAAHVSKVVREMTEPKQLERPVVRDLPSDAMNFATIAISQLERIRRDDPRRNEALTRVENWIKKNRR